MRLHACATATVSWQRGEERGDGGVIAEGFAEVGEAIRIARAEDEAAAELKRVLAQAVLAKAGGVGAFASGFVFAPENMQQVSAAQAGSTIGLAFRIHQERKCDVRLFAKDARVVRVAQADGGDLRVFPAEGRFVFAQLRDVLAAEHSTVVPQENEHGGIRGPQRTELHFTAVSVRQNDARKPSAKSCFHVYTFSDGCAAASSDRNAAEWPNLVLCFVRPRLPAWLHKPA